MRCKSCGTEFHKKLETCPSCGKSLKPSTIATIVGILLFTMAIVIVSAAIATKPDAPQDSKPKAPAWMKSDSSSSAYFAAMPYVKANLNFPETSEWPGIGSKTQHVKPLANQRYAIYSWVKSKNALGVPVKTTWVAEIQQTEKDRWKLISLEFE